MRETEWSDESKRWTFGTLKEVVSEVPKGPDTIALHGGLPPEESFPIQSIKIKLYNDEIVEIPASMSQQQYNINAYGYEPLRAWCQDHTKSQHTCCSMHRTMVTDSTTHALDVVTSLLLNPGDAILIEEFTYSHFIDCTVDRKEYQSLAVPMDNDGIIPDELERIIEKQLSSKVNGTECNGVHSRAIPKVLYLIPTAQNPTGGSLPKDRRADIYRICQKYDIYIIEDDPYYYLQYALDESELAQPGLSGLESHSLLPLDEDGRVIRLDSFAKFLAPGFRLGWATASERIIEKLAMQIQSETLGGNMMSQSIVAAMMEHWGYHGLEAYVRRMQKLYSDKAALTLHSLEKHMKDLAEWRIPTGGMFMWLKLLHVSDAHDVFISLRKQGIIVLPGYISQVEKYRDGNRIPCPYIRISFSHASHAALQHGIERMSSILRSHQ
ncbi:Kynurenine/alpha-aminoadipate aminotransferase [Picochlorum sp. SENEW3]|nr:Kynurenine/alpha-aminoadipate aminotransferase [Picochlorum sp. SENEW3]WPT14559.1 Kynurenine/alpha-aminoadipate aminotransferase [Picochlorum sp. SENEW3]